MRTHRTKHVVRKAGTPSIVLLTLLLAVSPALPGGRDIPDRKTGEADTAQPTVKSGDGSGSSVLCPETDASAVYGWGSVGIGTASVETSDGGWLESLRRAFSRIWGRNTDSGSCKS